MAVHLSTLRRWSTLAVAMLLVSGLLAACGGSSGDDSGLSSAASTPAQSSDAAAGGSTIDISAMEMGGDELGFSMRSLTARAGTITIKLANGSSDMLPHAIAIEGNGVDEDGMVVQPGGNSTVTVRLKPGRYTFYCPVGDHEEDGMKGTLTVT